MKYRQLSNQKLVLTEKEPLKRLYEFCRIGNYKYHIFWDRFQNGLLITCEVFYFLYKQRKNVHKETQFVTCDNDVNYAKNVVCESFLHNIGLGMSVNETLNYIPITPEREENEFDEVNSQMESTFTKVLGRTVQTLTETIKNDLSNNDSMTPEGEQLGNLLANVTNIMGAALSSYEGKF